jgi:hypothetical protein
MIKFHKTASGTTIAELTDISFIISHYQDALDLMADFGIHDCSRIIIHERNLHKDFFNLKTRLAGDILQKFSNYKIKLALVGDFSKYESKSLQDFIRESNKGNMIFFVENAEAALIRLTK